MADPVPDSFPGAPRQLTYPGSHAIVVSPNDSTPLPFVSRGIYVGTTGNIALVLQSDPLSAPVVFSNVQSGSLLPLRATYVMNTNTTASNIVAIQ